MTVAAPFQTETYKPRANITLAAWLRKKLPLRDYLLGTVLSTTSRWILFGETGVGKTLFTMALGGAASSGTSLLKWQARRRARVMYIDGELPAETFKERMEIVARQYGADLPFFGYNRDDLGDDAMPPFNTPKGEEWLWREIDLIKPDLIIFDSIMCLLIGSMAEEESWAPVKVLMRKISSRRIAQIWLHHTGHDPSKGFGTKTREWEVDTVVSLTQAQPETDDVALEFKKARLRNPETRAEFDSCVIRYGADGWTSDGVSVAAKRGKASGEKDHVRRAIVAAYDRFASDEGASPGFDGAPVRKVRADRIRDEVKSRGYLDTNEKGQLSPSARTLLRRAKAELLAGGSFVESDGWIWRIGSKS